jgi:hypothetical protein
MTSSPQRVKRSTKITAKTGKSIAQTAAGFAFVDGNKDPVIPVAQAPRLYDTRQQLGRKPASR